MIVHLFQESGTVLQYTENSGNNIVKIFQEDGLDLQYQASPGMKLALSLYGGMRDGNYHPTIILSPTEPSDLTPFAVIWVVQPS